MKIGNNSFRWWMIDGKGESLCANGNSFLGLHNHHVCDGKPSDKAVTILMAKKTSHTNQEILHFSVSILFYSERIVLLNLKHKIPCSWFLSHHSYSDFIYHGIEIPTSYINFEIQKLLKATLELVNHSDEHRVLKQRICVSGV